MKAGYLAAAAAALMEGVSAHRVHRHAHELFHAKKGLNDSEICVPECTTIYTTITGSPIWVPTPGPSTTSTTSLSSSSTPVAPTSTVTIPAEVPTPIAQTCPTPGTYTFPATTLTLTETTTVCGASTTTVPSGTHTLGGVTTVVTTATTVVCPYATTKVTSGVVTSVIETTTYVCPSAGTYTIGPITETVTATETVVVVPVVETYCPGTYTAPAVTTVVTTQTVVYCPYTSSAAPTLATSVPTTAAPVEASPTETKAAETSPAATYSGGGKAIAYTPYTADEGLCKSAEEVDADIAKIAKAGFGQVRTYSTDCDTLPNVGAACEKYGIKMVVGIFIGQAGCTNASPDVEEQISALKSWKKWDIVPLVVVANEALFQGHCTVSELSALITHVKSELGSAGYTGAYTTTDTVGAWIQAGVSDAICDLVDIVAINAYPYFAGNVFASAAGEFVASQLDIVETLCGKDGLVLECGHPSEGKCYGDLCGSKEEQKEVIGSIIDKLGDKVTILGFTNDKWKAPGDCGCEQHWGCGDLFGF